MPKRPSKSSPAQTTDRDVRAEMSRLSGGLAPSAFATAWVDWAMQLAQSPARQMELQQQALMRGADTLQFALRAMSGTPLPPTEGLEGKPDARLSGEAWNQFPFNLFARAYQQQAAGAKETVRGVDGLSDYHAQLLEFALRMMLDAASPANFLPTNPELLAQTQTENGENLVRGARHLMEDMQRNASGGAPPGTEAFPLGEAVAATPGKVVFRNALIELIQYSPTTPQVHAEPVLVVPAWIMKYYILDLSPRNSMVKFLVDQGHTVFMISWKNPGVEDRDLEMDDYLNLGLRAALDAVSTLVPKRSVHAVGYCIGGTLLSIGAAALAREGDDRIGSITMFAAQTDFSEPGELSYFINPAQLAMLDASMNRKGVLDSGQMGGAFALMRAQDLVWQPAVNNYLKGQRDKMIDLMAWNADGTRMPYRMHTDYLQRLYLRNELASNRFEVGGQRIRLSDLRMPMFVVGTETDHVAPWHSVYKVGNLVRSDDYSFLLTAGGHNAGIICGPVHPKRHYRLLTRRLADAHLAPEDWMAAAPRFEGAWWPAWQQWLVAHSASDPVKPPAMGSASKGYAVLEDAPGQYVRQR